MDLSGDHTTAIGLRRRARAPNPNTLQKVNQDLLSIFVPLEQKQFRNSRLNFRSKGKQLGQSERSREIFSSDAKSKLTTNNGAMRIQKIIKKNSKRYFRGPGAAAYLDSPPIRESLVIKNGNTASNSPQTSAQEQSQVQPSSNKPGELNQKLLTADDCPGQGSASNEEYKSLRSARPLPKLDDIIVGKGETPDESMSFEPKDSPFIRSPPEELKEAEGFDTGSRRVLRSPTANSKMIRSQGESISSSYKRGSRKAQQGPLPAIEDEALSRMQNTQLTPPQEYSFARLSETQRLSGERARDLLSQQNQVRIVRRNYRKVNNSRVSFRNQSLVGLVTGDPSNLPELLIEKKSSYPIEASLRNENSRMSSQEEGYYPTSTFHNGLLANDTPSQREANNATTQSNFSQAAQQHPKAFKSTPMKMPHLAKGSLKQSSSKNPSSKVASHLAIRSSDRILIEDSGPRPGPKFSNLRIESNKIILHDLKQEQVQSQDELQKPSKVLSGHPQFMMEKVIEQSPNQSQEPTSQLLNRSFLDQKRQREKRQQQRKNAKLLTYLSSSSNMESTFDYSKIGMPNSSFTALRVQSLERPTEKASPNPLEVINQESLENEIRLVDVVNVESLQSSRAKQAGKPAPRLSYQFHSFSNPPFDEQNEGRSLPSNETFMAPDWNREIRTGAQKRSDVPSSSQLNESTFHLGSRIEKSPEGILKEKVTELKLVGQKKNLPRKLQKPPALKSSSPERVLPNQGGRLRWSPASPTQYRERLQPILQHTQIYKSPQQLRALPSIARPKKKAPSPPKMTSKMILQEMHEMTRNCKFVKKATSQITSHVPSSKQFKAPNFRRAKNSKGFGRNTSCSMERRSPSPSQKSSYKKQSQFASREDTLHQSLNHGISILRESTDARSKAASPIPSPRIIFVQKVTIADKKAKPGQILPMRGVLHPQNQSKLDLLQISTKQITEARNLRDLKLFRRNGGQRQPPPALSEEDSPLYKPRSRRCSTCRHSESRQSRRNEESPRKRAPGVPKIMEATEASQELLPMMPEPSLNQEINTLRKPGDCSESLTLRMA